MSYVSLSLGNHDGLRDGRPTTAYTAPWLVGDTPAAEAARLIRERVSCPVLVTGRVTTPQHAQQLIERGRGRSRRLGSRSRGRSTLRRAGDPRRGRPDRHLHRLQRMHIGPVLVSGESAGRPRGRIDGAPSAITPAGGGGRRGTGRCRCSDDGCFAGDTRWCCSTMHPTQAAPWRYSGRAEVLSAWRPFERCCCNGRFASRASTSGPDTVWPPRTSQHSNPTPSSSRRAPSKARPTSTPDTEPRTGLQVLSEGPLFGRWAGRRGRRGRAASGAVSRRRGDARCAGSR